MAVCHVELDVAGIEIELETEIEIKSTEIKTENGGRCVGGKTPGWGTERTRNVTEKAKKRQK